MKLRDLARSAGDPGFTPAFHLFRSRFRSRGTSRRSRKSYESVPVVSSDLRLLTLLQRAAVVVVLGILRRPCHPGSCVKFPIRTYHRNQYVRKRTCHRHASFLHFPIFEQNQRKSYREVLIAGDLSQEDIGQATTQLGEFQVSMTVNGFWSTCSDTVPRTLPIHGPCSHMAEVCPTPPSSFTAATPSTSPNRVCPSLSLAVLGLGLSINRRLPVRRIPRTILFH